MSVTYKIVCDVVGEETYFVTADSEDEAREAVMSGECPEPAHTEVWLDGVDSIEEWEG